MANGNEARFALDVDSLASVCNDGCVVFRQRNDDDDMATAILLVGNPTAQRQICKVKTTCNKMFVIRPAVFDLEAHSELPVKITYIPTSDTAGKQREEQWFAIHYITSTDDNKSPHECWADNGTRADIVKRLRAKFEKVKEGVVTHNKEMGATSMNGMLFQNVDGKASETLLRCIPNDTILFTPANDSNEKRLITTMSFINCAQMRRAVQVCCPLDPQSNKYHVEMFTVDPDMQYNLTMCFLPSRKFRQQAKIDRPFIIVTHIDAPDLNKTAEQVWDEFNKTPNAHCIIKKIPIHYDEAKLEALLNERKIDDGYMMSGNEIDENGNVMPSLDERNGQDGAREPKERNEGVRNRLITTGADVLKSGNDENNDFMNHGQESNVDRDADESDRGAKVSDGRI